jgi:hypothetical protein
VYSDDHACPVLIQKRLKRERRDVRAVVFNGKAESAIAKELREKKAEVPEGINQQDPTQVG